MTGASTFLVEHLNRDRYILQILLDTPGRHDDLSKFVRWAKRLANRPK